jgi:hypothetical protein
MVFQVGQKKKYQKRKKKQSKEEEGRRRRKQSSDLRLDLDESTHLLHLLSVTTKGRAGFPEVSECALETSQGPHGDHSVKGWERITLPNFPVPRQTANESMTYKSRATRLACDMTLLRNGWKKPQKLMTVNVPDNTLFRVRNLNSKHVVRTVWCP